MLFKTPSLAFITLLWFPSLALSSCGSDAPSAEALKAAHGLQLRSHTTESLDGRRGYERNDTLHINTYLHVVESRDFIGYVTDEMLNAQVRVLNETFHPHHIQFNVVNISHTVNDEWASVTRHPEKARALRRGGYDELNIYFETGLMREDSVTGICSWAVEDPENTGINGTSWAVYDACHVSPATMPEGPGVPWLQHKRQGKTATHEVGHWFGLFHTFDGESCEGDGDFVADTPMQLMATEGCPSEADSCPNQPGLDPVHNYMDYSSDECQFEFTPLQEDRMYASFNQLRKGKRFPSDLIIQPSTDSLSE